MATEVHEAASELMDKVLAPGFISDKKGPLINPRFTPPAGLTNLQLASIAALAKEPDAPSSTTRPWAEFL